MDHDLAVALATAFLGRKPDTSEQVAMHGQAERAARWIANREAGANNPLFDMEPDHWRRLMLEAQP